MEEAHIQHTFRKDVSSSSGEQNVSPTVSSGDLSLKPLLSQLLLPSTATDKLLKATSSKSNWKK